MGQAKFLSGLFRTINKLHPNDYQLSKSAQQQRLSGSPANPLSIRWHQTHAGDYNPRAGGASAAPADADDHGCCSGHPGTVLPAVGHSPAVGLSSIP